MPLRDHIIERIQKSSGPSISISNAGLSDADVDEVVTLVNSNPKITSLELNCNNIRNEGGKKLALLLHLQSLYVSQNNFGDEAAIVLVKAPQFISLDISRSRAITDKTAKVILEDAHQIALNVDGANISDELSNQISEHIKKNRQNYYDNIKKNKKETKYTEVTGGKTTSSPSLSGVFSKITVKPELVDSLGDEKYSPPLSLINGSSSKEW